VRKRAYWCQSLKLYVPNVYFILNGKPKKLGELLPKIVSPQMAEDREYEKQLEDVSQGWEKISRNKNYLK